MYVPRAFRETSREKLCALIEQHSFGLLISVDGAAPRVTHVPFLLRRAPDRLLTHVARANPHWRALEPALKRYAYSRARTPTSHPPGIRIRTRCRPGTTRRCTRAGAPACSMSVNCATWS